ncbi:MAG TPA: hypothetical protein VN033_09115 [Vulgatibacter sp.]|nr:hypothetical protein [Vulgatibacter sp.]
MYRLAAALAVATLLPALPAHASLIENQHDGFFFRFHLGAGHFDADWRDGPADSLSVGGRSAHLGFALGGAIARNLILFGEVTSEAAANPTYRYMGFEDELGTTVGLFGYGPGVAWYLMPLNLYLSGTALVMHASESDEEAVSRWAGGTA